MFFDQVDEDQPEELQNVRKDLNGCFDEMECFLLPYPGKARSSHSLKRTNYNFEGREVTNPAFKGLGSEIDPEFLEHLKAFIPTVLSSSSITVKTSSGREVRCKDMIQYFKSYMTVLNVSIIHLSKI